LNGITYAEGVFVAVGNSGRILTSADAVTWTERASNVNIDLYDVTYGNNTFVIVGEGSTILQSAPFTPIQSLNAPNLNVVVTQNSVILSWNLVDGADGYTLYFAPPDVSYIGSLDMSNNTGLVFNFIQGTAAFYVAVKAYNSNLTSEYSNIEYFSVP